MLSGLAILLCCLSIVKVKAFNKDTDYYIESSVPSVQGRYEFDDVLFEQSTIGQYIFKKIDANLYLYQVIDPEQHLTRSWHVGSDYQSAANPLLSCGYPSSSSSSSASRRRLGGKGARGGHRRSHSNSHSSSSSSNSRHSCRWSKAMWFKADNMLDKDFRIRTEKRNVQNVKNLEHKDICLSYVSTTPGGAGFDFVGAYHAINNNPVTAESLQYEYFPGIVWVKTSQSPSEYIYFLGNPDQAFIYMDDDLDVTNGYAYRCDLGDGFDKFSSLPTITDCPLNQWQVGDFTAFDADMITSHCEQDFYQNSICIQDKKVSETNSASDGVYHYKAFESGFWTGSKYEKVDGSNNRWLYPYQWTASSVEYVGWGIWKTELQSVAPIWRCGFKKSALPTTTPFISNIFEDCDQIDWDFYDGSLWKTNSQLKIVRCPTTIRNF